MIDLHYDDDHPREWYVRGHVDEAAAIADVRASLAAELEEDEQVPTLGNIAHIYARWGFDLNEFGERRSQRFKPYVPRRQGAFAVTVVRDLDYAAHELARRGKLNAQGQALAARVRERWPTATGLDVSCWPQLNAVVRFRLPELIGIVEVRGLDFKTAGVETRDVKTFMRLYARREAQ